MSIGSISFFFLTPRLLKELKRILMTKYDQCYFFWCIKKKKRKFIYQLSIEDIEIAIRTLKEPICFIKEDKEKQLILLVIVIRLDNNSWIDA